MATIIHVDGTFEPVTAQGEHERLTLEQLQAAIGGNVALADIVDDGYTYDYASTHTMYVREDGLDLPMNRAASRLNGRPLNGDAIYCTLREGGLGPDEYDVPDEPPY